MSKNSGAPARRGARAGSIEFTLTIPAFEMAEVAISKSLFAEILRMIVKLRPPPVASTGWKAAKRDAFDLN